ncbi:uncharacterized protein LOC21393384 isoform X1 [Morus notabilis]|uniref:uncharacterized protein LOC21393384 isoform X1 n=1 Tax=Morus notabilis TaxID=981085 RepID=UPI000CED6D49|nr:uncharacterized protein LOC21393384 isoform X1 [Morus notabilis]XP_024024423.1 uncharacterized protein LOC21393384 isoform X1 [Morus notabilis]XP_024024424.1 uncharacterized protein LOC21393384 isoform X1 [Morus notabilis]
MDFDRFYLLFILSLLCSQARAESSGSVFFIDGSSQQFFRKSSDDVVKPDSIVDTEAGAAISILLGFAPPSTLSAASSSKLNQVLVPNPFNRPRAVFMLEIRGADDSKLLAKDDTIFSNALSSKIFIRSKKAEIQLPDEDEIVVVSLDEPLADFNDKELGNFASWIGGTYLSENEEPLNGELIIPLATGANLKLHMSKKADREFTLSVLSLVRNSRRAIEMHEDISHGLHYPAELLTGSFDGIKVLQEQYGPEVAELGMDVLLATFSKLYTALEATYKGQIVGVIFCYGTDASPESGKMMDVVFAPRRSVRWLEETEASDEVTLSVLLVRRTLAWITGIILVIATLLGIYFLLNMPLTRDTLLYSNVKLD